MSDKEKLIMMYKQIASSNSPKAKAELQRGIYKLEKKIKQEKAGLRYKDGIYFQTIQRSKNG